MTFYEAAVEVLRQAGRPLHFKKITETAIRSEMLSHVGKTPEVTMGNRLDQEVKKANGTWLVQTRPGVYTLRDEVAERLNEEAAEREAKEAKKRDSRKEQEEKPQKEDEPQKDRQEARGDDGDDNGGDGRRRRRRRRNGGDGGGGSRRRGGKGDDQKGNRGKGGQKDRNKGGQKKAKKKSDDGGDLDLDLDKTRFDSIAEAAYGVLKATGRKALDVEDLADVIFDKKLIRFHTHDPAATVQSAMATDNQVRQKRGKRPYFAQYQGDRWGLTEWGISDDGIKREQKILELADEQRRDAVRQLGKSLLELKPEALEMVVMTLLERLDYRNLKVSKRTSDGDVFFTADWRRGFSDMRVCIQIVEDSSASIDGNTVTELRETLEHYSATEGVIIHLGDVGKEAVKESRDEEKAKITVIDRKSFVRLLVEHGIGVKTYQTPVLMVDTAFVDALSEE